MKLILQPILENAIDSGVREMDDCGEIIVKGKKEKGNIILSVEDNGLGMTSRRSGICIDGQQSDSQTWFRRRFGEYQ